MLSSERWEEILAAVEGERAAIVRWLRSGKTGHDGIELEYAAHDIEAGAHHRVATQTPNEE